MTGIALFVFAIFLLEPWFLTWELRKRGEALQITDEGVLRRLARGDSEFVRWSELREVSIVLTQGVNLSEDYFLRARRRRLVGGARGPGARHEIRPALAPVQTTRLRPPQHHHGHGVAGEPEVHAVARGAARGRGRCPAEPLVRELIAVSGASSATWLPSLRVNITAAPSPWKCRSTSG